MRYRLKPREIQAIRWDGTEEAANLIALIAGDSFETLDTPWNDNPDATAVCRSSMHGGDWVPVTTGTFIVLDDEGGLYPLYSTLLHDNYEAVTE